MGTHSPSHETLPCCTLVKGQYGVPGPARLIDAALRREAKVNRY